MKENIKNIIRIIAFIIVLSFVVSFISYLKKPKTVDLQNIAGFYSEKRDSLDMVYIGGSAAFVYWQPLTAYEDYGIASYLYSANTVQAECYKYMIEEILKTQSPKLIIIDARAFQYRDKDQPPTEAAYRNILTGMPFSINKINLVNNIVRQNLHQPRKSYIFDIALYHSDKSPIGLKTSVNMMLRRYENELKGFYFVPKALRMKRIDASTDEVKKVSDKTTEILVDLLKYIKRKNVNVLFTVSPYIETKSEKANYNYIQSIIEDYNCDFIDTNDYVDDMGINYDYDFYNYNHVNIYGSDKYTDFLARFIKENYELEDKRLDKKYESWNALLDTWNICKKIDKSIISKKIGGEKYNEELYIKQ